MVVVVQRGWKQGRVDDDGRRQFTVSCSRMDEACFVARCALGRRAQAGAPRGMPRWLVSANVRVAPPRTVRARSAAGESPAAGKVSNLDRAKANGGRVLAGDAEGEDETRVKN